MRLVQWNSTGAGTAPAPSGTERLHTSHDIALVRVPRALGQGVNPPTELLAAATALREASGLPNFGAGKLRFLDIACPGEDPTKLQDAPLALVLFGIESLDSAPDQADLDAMALAAAEFDSNGHDGLPPIRVGWIHDDPGAADRLLQSGSFDLVLRGEADELLPRVVESALGGAVGAPMDWRGFRGVSWVAPDGVAQHGAVDSAPLRLRAPAWDLVDLSRYDRGTGHRWNGLLGLGRPQVGAERRRGRPLSRPVNLTTCRECPPHCPTCHGSFGSHGRAVRSSEVIAEIRDLVTRQRVRKLSITDHAFDGDTARALTIAEAVAQLRLAPGCGSLTVTFPKGLRGDGLTPALIDALVRAGVSTFPLRVTTAAPRLQRLLKENIDLERVSRALEEIARRGKRGHLMLRLGLPTETTGEVAQTIRWARRSTAATAEFKNGRTVDLGPAWTRTDEGELDDFKALRRRALTAFYSSPIRAGRLARGAPRSLLHGLQAQF